MNMAYFLCHKTIKLTLCSKDRIIICCNKVQEREIYNNITRRKLDRDILTQGLYLKYEALYHHKIK